MKIALLEPLGVPQSLIDELSAPVKEAGHEFVSYTSKTTDPQELAQRAAGCEVVMIANNKFPAEVVEACPDMKLLNVAFTGIDHIALDACRAHQVMICNAANYSNQTVAEMAIGMTIALLRKFTAGDTAVRNGGTSAGLMGREIAGRTVGIIGTGRIGMMTAKIFLAFGAKVIACSGHVRPDAVAMGIEYMSLEEVMAKSDIISIHTPNTPATRNLISRDMISRMKPTAILINCARGPIVDSAALADALNEGKIAGAGIDVYQVEPPIPDGEPLLHAKNTLLTPHVAFLSEEAMVRRAHIVFQNLMGYLQGKPENVCKY